MKYLGRQTIRRVVLLAALGATIALLTANTTLGALINGSLPAASFTYASITDNAVNVDSGGVTPERLAALKAYVLKLSAIKNPTDGQRAALATYTARLADAQARYDVAVALRESVSANIKTTYSRVPPADTFESGWHYHNGPVIVTVTAGTLTFVDSKCHTWDLPAGHTYIESPRQVLNAKALPAKNPGVANVEWFTTRLYPKGAIDPVPVAAPCKA